MNTDKSSFIYWYPKIKGKMDTPKSIIIPFTSEDGNKILNDDTNALCDLCDTIIHELRENNIKFPIFFKTDYYAAKWYWSDSCFIESKEDLGKNILYLLTMNQEDDDRPINALVFKQYIQTETKFFAFNGMPVCKERRYFIENKKVLCHHPYWEQESIEFFNEDYPENWEELLNTINIETSTEVEYLTHAAERFAELIDDNGYFSVDFMQGIGNTWYVIDCAEGHKSYHNEDCEVFQNKNMSFE